MKTKKAIRLIREGKIQVEADTTKINKFLKKAFPNDSCSPKDKYYKKWYISGFQWQSLNTPFDDIPIIKLSEITNRKTLKKRVEKLEEFVTEFLEFNPNFPRFEPIDYSENESLSEVAETAFKPDFENVTESEFVLPEKWKVNPENEEQANILKKYKGGDFISDIFRTCLTSDNVFKFRGFDPDHTEITFQQFLTHVYEPCKKSQSESEKICVRRNPENAKAVNDWANETRQSKIKITYTRSDGFIYFDAKNPKKTISCVKQKHHKEITFSQFEERFLKPMEDENNEAEIGVWWNYEVGSLIFRTAKDKYFGFAHGAWVNEIQNYEIDFNGVGRKATESEVKQALEKYADENYPVGTRVKCLYNGDEHETIDVSFINYNNNDIWVCCGIYNACIYKDGTWATILPQKEIDWDKKEMMISKNSDFVVFKTENENDYAFKGFVVKGNEHFDIGDYLVNWDKSSFKPHKYPVTINPIN